MPSSTSPGCSTASRAFLRRTSLLLQHHAPVDHNIFIRDIELGDAAGDLGPDQLLEFRCIARAAAAGRHKRAHADVDVSGRPSPRPVTVPTTASLLLESLFERRPVVRLRHFEPRQVVVALFVAALDRDRDLLARLHTFRIVPERRTRQHAFDLVADIDEDLFGGNRDNRALNLLCAARRLMRVAALELHEDVCEILQRLGRLFRRSFFGYGRSRRLRNLLGRYRLSAAGAVVNSAAPSPTGISIGPLFVDGVSEVELDSGTLSLLIWSTVPFSHGMAAANRVARTWISPSDGYSGNSATFGSTRCGARCVGPPLSSITLEISPLSSSATVIMW